MADFRQLGAVFVGGAIGTTARAVLADEVPSNPHSWPWPTFAVNILGALLIGYFGTRLAASSYRRSLLCTGVCGGLTTFSTMQLELVKMLDEGVYGLAAGYAAASVAVGLLAVSLASRLARR